VDAELLAVKAVKTKLERLVRVELALDELVDVVLEPWRKGKKLASKEIENVKPGERLLRLVIGKGISQGRATLEIPLEDEAGNDLAFSRRVKVPAKPA
jgi:hypothetical protein